MSEDIDSVESTEVAAPEAAEVETVFFVIKDKESVNGNDASHNHRGNQS